MPSVDVNWLAIVVAAAINMVVGTIWYAKGVFGKEWSKLTGRSMEDMTGGAIGYGIATVGALLQSWVLAHFVVYAGSNTFWKGLVTGFWLWLAFAAVVTAVHYAFEGRSWLLWKINAGYFLIVLLINGGLLAAWK
ncbi:hypothetical protein A3F65_00850 [Candidatus Saccharibacteria bacterium RIFCSPHIGHO2_12_FULL_47_16b]|nr:MAG: hypothetical protein A3F65_00850 [Candidatus Saccharibacteria bacterium RIFCSPHIGHO2_12_FULL_47_16b]